MHESRIPTDLTSFIGRGVELRDLSKLIDSARLITLTGSPGTGKTRLALRLVSSHAPDRTHWVELAPLREPGLVAPAVAEAAGIREDLRAGDLDGLTRLLRNHQGLLVLDNCEHLVDACAEIADRLLRECPELRILATSREALGVRGERAWLVPPLSLPARDGHTDAQESEAVRLFVERARDVVPDFELNPAVGPVVAEICRRLDGIPLAIELAAARVRMLQPSEILARLDDVFRLLTGGGRTVVPRHRTLRAAIDWSYELLSDPARALLRRLAVFRGGFTLAAAEAVGPGGLVKEEEVLDLVARLVDRSMLVVREHQGFARYHLLEAVRQYATEKLVESEEEPSARLRMARYLLALVEEAEPHFTRRERRVWVDRLHPEIDSLRSALGWSTEHEPELHVRLAGKLWWFWFSTQHWAEGARWIDRALALPAAAAPGPDRAALLFAAGALAALQARPDTARPALEEAIVLAELHGDDRLAAYARNYLGLTHAGEGRPEGSALCGRAEAWFREHDDLYGLRLALLLQGSVAMGQGRFEEAERLNREGVDVARLFGQDRELAVSLQNLAVVYLAQTRSDEAEPLVREALKALRRDPSHYFVAVGVGYLGEIEGQRGRPVEAARLLGAAEAIRELVGARQFLLDARRLETFLPRLRELAGEATFERAWSEGRGMAPEQLLEELAGDGAQDDEAARKPAGDEGAAAGAGAGGAGVGPAPVPLRVEALGPFAVYVDGERIEDERWPYAKPRELLIFLLLFPAGATRDQIGAALWPGAPRSSVKNSFHVSLHHLRRTLGHPEWIVVEGDRYRLHPGLDRTFDVDDFVAACRRAQGGAPEVIRNVLRLYRGELLERDAAGRWIDEHRDRLRRLHLELGLALGEALETTEPSEAAALYQALAAREDLDEEVHRRLMSVRARAGDRSGAIRHYERVVHLLRDALDADPEPETTALAEAIRTGCYPAPARASSNWTRHHTGAPASDRRAGWRNAEDDG